MHLQKELVLPQARIKKVKIVLGAEEHKITLEFQTALTQEVAEAFGCRELVYAGSVPRSGVDKMTLEGGEVDCSVHLQHTDFAFDSVVESVGKYEAHFEGDGPKLRFQVTFAGFVITVADLIEHVRVDPLEVVLKPAQQPLDLQEDQTLKAESERIEEFGCVDCANEVPLVDGDPSLHASGQPCAAYQALAPADGPALAPAAVMGGTHQRKNRKTKDVSAAEPEGEEGDFISELVQ
jgi:hypothetical protein